jgi:hypothetical protein
VRGVCFGAMPPRMRAPFVTTVASLVAGAGMGCANPPYTEVNCPSDRPTSGTDCSDPRVSCTYSAPGCEQSTSALVTATCHEGKWQLQSKGVSCNPPNPMPDSGVDAAGCPANEPAIGSTCTVTRCSYANLCPLSGAASKTTNSYFCSGGKWVFENDALAPIACPTVKPRDGEACGCAMYLPPSCSYAGACGSDTAKCDGATQKWSVIASPCDAGAD